jgi:hypothetical protein
MLEKPLDSGGFSYFGVATCAGEKRLTFAGHQGVALLNDALLQGLSGQVPGA